MKFEYDLNSSIKKIHQSNSYFHTFINKQSLAAGLLILKPGEKDTQEPHESDEIYYIISGDGYLRINKKDFSVKKDKIFFVKKDVVHYFHGNKNELKVLYFFGGPDS